MEVVMWGTLGSRLKARGRARGQALSTSGRTQTRSALSCQAHQRPPDCLGGGDGLGRAHATGPEVSS